jgi:hypothetical protein
MWPQVLKVREVLPEGVWEGTTEIIILQTI